MSGECSETHTRRCTQRDGAGLLARRQICVLRTVCYELCAGLLARRQIDWMCNSSSDCRGRVQARSSRRSRHSAVLEREAGLCYVLCAVCYELCATVCVLQSVC